MAEVTGTPWGGSGGGMSSLSFRVVVVADVVMDAGVVTVVPVTITDGLLMGLDAKLFLDALSFLQYVVVSIGPDPLFRWPEDGSSM